MDRLLGKRSSNIPKTKGSKMEVYTVLSPKSFPINRKPTISRKVLRIKVIREIFNGMMLANIMAKPEILPTDTWLGIIKKKTADATMIVAKVITKNSLSVSHSFILSPPEYYIVTAGPVFLQALPVIVS